MVSSYIRNYEEEARQRELRFETGKALAEELVYPYLKEIDVQPPTPQSLAAAAEIGIALGRAAYGYEREMGAGALNNAMHYVKTEYAQSGSDSDNFDTLGQAANEAFMASRFKYVKVVLPDVQS